MGLLNRLLGGEQQEETEEDEDEEEEPPEPEHLTEVIPLTTYDVEVEYLNGDVERLASVEEPEYSNGSLLLDTFEAEDYPEELIRIDSYGYIRTGRRYPHTEIPESTLARPAKVINKVTEKCRVVAEGVYVESNRSYKKWEKKYRIKEVVVIED